MKAWALQTCVDAVSQFGFNPLGLTTVLYWEGTGKLQHPNNAVLFNCGVFSFPFDLPQNRFKTTVQFALENDDFYASFLNV